MHVNKNKVGWNGNATWLHFTKTLGDRGLDLTELDTACEWGATSAARFQVYGTLNIIANPQRVKAF